ncbi:MAG TPA: hypothetical protein VK911_04480 [Vicinamibacterales bacterium]|nr:hypothetical protein [Vicinamibacterales bacterium]
MVPIVSLWLPILLSAVIVFVASSILHMLLPFHRSDYRKLPSEDEVMAALRRFGIPPGDYLVPCAVAPKEMNSPAFVDKMIKGPVAVMTVMRSGRPSMGGQLAQWFVYCLVVSVFAAYIAGRALEPGAHYLAAFRFAGTTAFVGYALALWQNTIWFKRHWLITLKSTVDGLIYGLLTAGVFGWLWP